MPLLPIIRRPFGRNIRWVWFGCTCSVQRTNETNRQQIILREKIRLYTLKVRNCTRHLVLFLTAIQTPLVLHLSKLFNCVEFDHLSDDATIDYYSKTMLALEYDTRIVCDSNFFLFIVRYLLLSFAVIALFGQIFLLADKLYRWERHNKKIHTYIKNICFAN